MHNLYTVFTRVLNICKSLSSEKLNKNNNIPRRGPVPAFSDLEIISLSLSSEMLGINSELHLFRIIHADFSDCFKRLGGRRNFNERRKNLFSLTNDFRLKMTRHIEANPEVFCVDSMPLPICKNARAKRSKICRDISSSFPTFGFCASQNMHYFGYKLHAVCSSQGIIYDMDMSQANVHDINYLNDLKGNLNNCILVGDKGDLSAQMQVDLFTHYKVHLEVPYRKNQINRKPVRKDYQKLRRRIETNFSQLEDQLCIRRNYAKTQRGLFTRILSKIVHCNIKCNMEQRSLT